VNDISQLPTAGYVFPKWVRDRYAISNSTMYAWIKAGRLPKPIRIGPRACASIRVSSRTSRRS
jgi:predicted DNA-binding transcriptional regulator AlpA